MEGTLGVVGPAVSHGKGDGDVEGGDHHLVALGVGLGHVPYLVGSGYDETGEVGILHEGLAAGGRSKRMRIAPPDTS